ncbi:MAG: NAD-dependent epimerase/dehydratase family protein [Robiginitomaculum sp.]|nr:NAD-dependent epimerase/dehydratase family protein [Robiginitomaculum sp.]
MSHKIVALTGGTGFVGRAVIRELLSQGYLIKALVRPGSSGKTIQHENVNWIEGTLDNPISEISLCAGVDTVIHMAGLVTARTKTEYYKINADAVGTLVQAAARAKVKRFVYLSSLVAQQAELSDYAGSKRAGEGQLARNLGAMKGVVVRAPAVFGAEDKATAPFYALIKKGWLPAPGGRNWRKRKIGLVHVDDLARFLTSACLDGSCDGRTVTTATRASITWPEFANECALALGKPVKVFPLPLSVLYPIAVINSATKRAFGKGHLTLGKLKEFLYEDWSVSVENETQTVLQSALKRTILSDYHE